jgi:hypothetical protein
MIIGTLIAVAFFVFALVVWESTRVAPRSCRWRSS